MSNTLDSAGDNQLKYKIKISVPFPSARLAEVAYDVLRVDTEPKRSGVLKELSLKENILEVKLSADVAKQLRVATNGIFANLILINQTIDCVGPPMPEHTPAPTPIRAVYGFAMYLSFKMFFVLYLIWAFVPHSWFEHFGITCLPQRYWAIAIPIYVITAVLIFGFVIYPSINLCITPDIDDLRTIADKSTSEKPNKEVVVNGDVSCNECVCVDQENCGLQNYLQDTINFDEKFVPLIEDLNITDVSRLLYLKTKLE